MLGELRRETEDEFPCTEAIYLKKLTNYIQRKEQDIKVANEELHERNNIKILEKESEKCLKRIKGKPNPSHDDVEAELDRLNKVYDNSAGGQNKEKLYFEYLKVFTPNLYREANLDHDSEKRIHELKEENNKLAEEIKKLNTK